MKSIVIFASGGGSNAENIIQYFNASPVARVAAVFCNNPRAGVIEKAMKQGVRLEMINRESLNSGEVLELLHSYQPDLIVLAGFLLKIPSDIISAYPQRIVNIHPAILPSYGGHGMYGMHVHQAVFDQKDPVSGISIHFVDEFYDEGDIVFQQEVGVADCQDAAEIAARVHLLEYAHYPKVIETLLRS